MSWIVPKLCKLCLGDVYTFAYLDTPCLYINAYIDLYTVKYSVLYMYNKIF